VYEVERGRQREVLVLVNKNSHALLPLLLKEVHFDTLRDQLFEELEGQSETPYEVAMLPRRRL
jgi:hypothetical protein